MAEDVAAPPLDLTPTAAVAAVGRGGGARSAGKRGLKREFAFALKVRDDLTSSSPLGRTRSGKIRRPPPAREATTDAGFDGHEEEAGVAGTREGSAAATLDEVKRPEDVEGDVAGPFGSPGAAVVEENEVEKQLEESMQKGVVKLTSTPLRETPEPEGPSSIVRLDEGSPIGTVLPDSHKQVGSCNLEVEEVPVLIRVEEPSEDEFVDAIDDFEMENGSVTGRDELKVEFSAAIQVDMDVCSDPPSRNNEMNGETTTRNCDENDPTCDADNTENSDVVFTVANRCRNEDETVVEMTVDSNSHQKALTVDTTEGLGCQATEDAVISVDQRMADIDTTSGQAASTELPKPSKRVTRSSLKTGTKTEHESKVQIAACNNGESEMVVEPVADGNGGETSLTSEMAIEANGHENLKGVCTKDDVNRDKGKAMMNKEADAIASEAIILGCQNYVKVENTVPSVGQSQMKLASVTDVDGRTTPVSTVKLARRITRSLLKSMTEETPQTPVPVPAKDGSRLASTGNVTSPVEEGSRLANKGRGRPRTTAVAQANGGPSLQSMSEGTPPRHAETPQMNGGSAVRILAEGASQTPVTMQIKKEHVLDTPSTTKYLGESIDKTKEDSEKPVRRFTRSLLRTKVSNKDKDKADNKADDKVNNKVDDKVNSKVDIKVDDKVDNKVDDKVDKAPPLDEVVTVSSTEASEESDGKSTVVNGPNGSLSTTLKTSLSALRAKLELKMSKKITLTKLPANVRDLLGTGLLEGLNVTYTSSNNRQWLRGVIKDGGILCFCASCKGTNAVSAYQFELHAGSTKKHPSDYITLENGSSINDVIRACTSAPLDMLETAIRRAISSEPNKGSICHQCNRSFQTTRIGKLSSVCDSCLVERLSKSPLPLGSPESISKNVSLQKKTSQGRMTTKDLWLHKLVFMNEMLPDGIEVAYYNRGKRLLDGYIKGSGIFCSCCNSVVSPSQFEAHAGFPARRKPYLNIYTSNGVSLHELSISLSKDKKYSTRENDDLCQICADGGDLLLCDLCPRAFHKGCVGLSTTPNGEWYCPCCQAMHQREKYVSHNKNAIAAGRISGVDPIEQIFKRCIRIVQTPETDASCCVLCRGHDFSKFEFGPRTVLLCDQCEKEFHIGCLKEHNIADLKELPQGTWFCCSDCGRIYTALHDSHMLESKLIPAPLVDIIKGKRTEKGLSTDSELDVRWRLIKGSTASSESGLLLSEATTIFHESFDPIIDLATRQDLIPAMVYGKDIGHQDFTGMYCAVLTISSTVVSAGLLRILGRDVAELPLVATSMASQGHGCFQTLFSCIEELLVLLGVERLVLPATKEAVAIWINKFGFHEITQAQLEEYTKGTRPMNFQGTPMLHKQISGSKPSSAEG